MKYFNKVIQWVLIIAVAAAMTMPALTDTSQAAKKKNVYVLKKVTVDKIMQDEDGQYSLSFTYDKKGLLKKTKFIKGENEAYIAKTTSIYNKKSQIKSEKSNIKDWTKKHNAKNKYKYNKKGYLSKITMYKPNGKIAYTAKFTWTSAGKIKTEKRYKKSGKLYKGYKYTYDTAGNLIKITEGDNVVTDAVSTVTKDGNNLNVITNTESGKPITKTTRVYNSRGQLTSQTIYRWEDSDWEDGKGEYRKDIVVKYSYKKIKTKKHSKVKKQQASAIQYMYQYDQMFWIGFSDDIDPFFMK